MNLETAHALSEEAVDFTTGPRATLKKWKHSLHGKFANKTKTYHSLKTFPLKMVFTILALVDGTLDLFTYKTQGSPVNMVTPKNITTNLGALATTAATVEMGRESALEGTFATTANPHQKSIDTVSQAFDKSIKQLFPLPPPVHAEAPVASEQHTEEPAPTIDRLFTWFEKRKFFKSTVSPTMDAPKGREENDTHESLHNGTH